MSTLDVYLHDTFTGKLTYREGRLSFAYVPDYLAPPEGRALSATLPFQTEAFGHGVTKAFFSGLLPDEGVREQLGRYLRVSHQNIFALLKEIGGECAGAVALYPEGVGPDTDAEPTYQRLDSDEAFDIISRLKQQPFLAGEDGIRISGAGAQDKLMVAVLDGQLAIPKYNTPSTHIIKPPISELEGSVHNEFFCLRLAAEMGLPVPQVDIYWLQNTPFYLIERYDRKQDAQGSLVRLHQEDFCQALGFPPDQKYQSEEGPSLKDCFHLLSQKIALGNMKGVDRFMLLRGVIFNYLIGNGDAHGKNFSLLYRGEATQLAPFYDLLSTQIYNQQYRAKMAMKLGSKYKFNNVRRRHLLSMGAEAGFKESFVELHLDNMCSHILTKSIELAETLNEDTATASPVYALILDVIQKHIEQLNQPLYPARSPNR